MSGQQNKEPSENVQLAAVYATGAGAMAGLLLLAPTVMKMLPRDLDGSPTLAHVLAVVVIGFASGSLGGFTGAKVATKVEQWRKPPAP